MRFFTTIRLVAGIVALWSVLKVDGCFAQEQVKPSGPTSKAEEALKRFLQAFDDDGTTRYIAAFYDLDGDGTAEAIVYLMSNEWCGSGGCNTLILKMEGSSWKIVTNIRITQPPIYVLTNTSNGWRNIGVWVQGGGIQPGYEAELRFDGKTYPTNPSIPPARPLTGKVSGQVVISSLQKGMPLYP